ncbi:MAG: TolC family protein [Pirellulales bacterium]|nr:TolC family protein [Pirellulales bacterium]|tara:strand:- start:2872 stop:4095 length:1224 start_codon:yes stop_codon:yes gene_type:complete
MRCIVIFLIYLAFSAPSYAQQREVNISYFRDLALTRSPVVSIGQQRVEAAKGRQVQAGLYPNTRVGYHANEIGMHGSDGAHGVFLQQRFITGGKRELDVQIAEQAVFSEQFFLEASKLRVLTDVDNAFGNLLIAQQKVDVLSTLVNVNRTTFDATKRLVEAGQSGKHVEWQASIELSQAEVARDQAIQEHQYAWRDLMFVCGQPNIKLVRVSGDVAKVVNGGSFQAVVESIINKSPQVAMAQQRIQQATLNVRRQKLETVPNIDAMVSLRNHSLTGDNITNIQVGIPVPLFDKNQGNIRAAEAEEAMRRAELRRLKLSLRQRAASVYRDFETARIAESRYREEILGSATKNLNLITKGYQDGQVDFLSMLTAQRTLLNVQLTYLRSSRKLHNAVTKLNGHLLFDSLR